MRASRLRANRVERVERRQRILGSRAPSRGVSRVGAPDEGGSGAVFMTKHSASETEAAGAINETQALGALEATLAHTFANRRYLLDALTHRSYAYEFAGPGVVSNERLEFLGDAVIALIASDLLFARYPAADEGTLTQYRAALVRASTLARFADDLHLGAYLRLGRGEDATGGRTRQLLLASAFEAVVGALYLDGKLPVARRFLEPLLAGAIEHISQNGGQRQIKDDKSLLQELAQGELGVTPRYRVVARSGPSHERTFEVEVLLGEVVAAEVRGIVSGKPSRARRMRRWRSRAGASWRRRVCVRRRSAWGQLAARVRSHRSPMPRLIGVRLALPSMRAKRIVVGVARVQGAVARRRC